MRGLFWVFVALNALFFASMQWGSWSGGKQPAANLPPLNAEKIRVFGAKQSTLPDAAIVSDGALTCMEWGDFFGDELQGVVDAVSALNLGDKLTRRETERSIGYWVYMPPLADKAAVNNKIRQLKERGVKDYFVEQEAGPWLNAISLGVFKTEEAAQKFLDDLSRKDVRTARVGERISKFKATTFLFGGITADAARNLAKLQQNHPGGELKNVPCH